MRARRSFFCCLDGPKDQKTAMLRLFSPTFRFLGDFLDILRRLALFLCYQLLRLTVQVTIWLGDPDRAIPLTDRYSRNEGVRD